MQILERVEYFRNINGRGGGERKGRMKFSQRDGVTVNFNVGDTFSVDCD